MQAEQLLRFLQDPHKTTPEDVVALHNLLKLYPYFQAAYALIAKEAYDRDQHSACQEIQTAAVYATDRHHLKALLEDTPPFSAPTPEVAPAISASKEEAGHAQPPISHVGLWHPKISSNSLDW